jgi:hypothetical protein
MLDLPGCLAEGCQFDDGSKRDNKLVTKLLQLAAGLAANLDLESCQV